MGYATYVRHPGRGILEVRPEVTIRFDTMHAVTRNRVRRELTNNVISYGWGTKVHAVIEALAGHYDVLPDLMHYEVVQHPDFDAEKFAARMLLIDYSFNILQASNSYRYRWGSLTYVGPLSYEERAEQKVTDNMRMVRDAELIPIARKTIDYERLAPILKAIDDRVPYTFTGTNKR